MFCPQCILLSAFTPDTLTFRVTLLCSRRSMSRVGRVGRVVLLDGGMGRELLNRGVPQEAGLWSATSVAREQPPEITKGRT